MGGTTTRKRDARATSARKPAGRGRAARALTWDTLAPLLSVDIRRLYRLRLEPGAPAAPDVEAWRTFIAARGAAGAGAEPAKSSAQVEREQADLRYARARAEREERENAVSAGRVVTREQAERAAAVVRDAYIAEGEQLGPAVAALLQALTRPQRDSVEAAVRQAWMAARARLAKGLAR